MSVTYVANEKVLCYHGPHIYEAKILKTRGAELSIEEDAPLDFFVHYKGWKQSWDEWVPQSRLLKFDDAGLLKQQQVIDAAKAAAAAAQAGTSSAGAASGATGGRQSMGGAGDKSKKKGATAATAGGEGSTRKRPREDNAEEYLKRPEVKINIPDVLKVLLVDDWENVTKSKQLVTLPRRPTVEQLIEEFKEWATKRAIAAQRPQTLEKRVAILTEVLTGLQYYFDVALGRNLLYKMERLQYKEQMRLHQSANSGKSGPALVGGPEFKASKVYGAEHLLRLFVNLPSYIAHTAMDADSVTILQEHIADFMGFMVLERQRIFQKEYDQASPTFVAQSKA